MNAGMLMMFAHSQHECWHVNDVCTVNMNAGSVNDVCTQSVLKTKAEATPPLCVAHPLNFPWW